jgi:hypothetical protein
MISDFDRLWKRGSALSSVKLNMSEDPNDSRLEGFRIFHLLKKECRKVFFV